MTGVRLSYLPSEDQDLIRSAARKYLTEKIPSDRVREIMMASEPDRSLWDELADLGWAGFLVPEEYGGSGFGYPDAAVLAEELGRAVTPGPFLASAVLATTALLGSGDPRRHGDLLSGMADGSVVAASAIYEKRRGWDPEDIDTTANPDGDGWVITGRKRWVLSAPHADMFLVSARTDDGVDLFAVPSDTVIVTPTPTLDATRRQGDVVFDSVAVPAEARLGGGEENLRRTLDIGAAVVASEQVGVASAAFDMALDHARTRFQFGRAIGSFQAVKHRLADMLTRLENARSVALHAVRVVDDPVELAIAAPLAAVIAGPVANWITGESIQIHGGIGFTWEHDAHLYFKRAKAASLLLGDHGYHLSRMGDALGL